MEFSIFKTALWQLVGQMDFVAILILVGLFCLSILCVAAIIFKTINFYRHHNSLKIMLENMKHAKNIRDLISINKEFSKTIGSKFLIKPLHELHSLLDANAQKTSTDTTITTLTKQNYEILETVVSQTIDNVLHEEEIYLPLLGTSAAVGPLIGLFGTIWGLIHAFVDISQEKTADIATVAPGMAEALIVTLAGLVVAIPAMVAFHYLSNELRKIEFQLCALGDKFLSISQKTFIK